MPTKSYQKYGRDGRISGVGLEQANIVRLGASQNPLGVVRATSSRMWTCDERARCTKCTLHSFF